MFQAFIMRLYPTLFDSMRLLRLICVLQDEKEDESLLKILYSGYNDVSKGIRLVARGFDKVKAVLAKRPNLRNLHKVFAKFLPAMPSTPDSWQVAPYTRPAAATPAEARPTISKAKVRDREIVLPQEYIPGNYSRPEVFTDELKKPCRPTDNPTKYGCRVCEIKPFDSWGKCDKHIRECHRGWKYGPCPQCELFYSWNRDSFTRHMKVNCSKRAQSGEAGPAPKQ